MVPFDAVIRAATTADAPAIAAIYRPFVVRGAISFEMEPPDAATIAARIEMVTADHPWLVAENDDGDVIIVECWFRSNAKQSIWTGVARSSVGSLPRRWL